MAEKSARRTPGCLQGCGEAHNCTAERIGSCYLTRRLFLVCFVGPRYTPLRKQNKVNMLQQSLDDPLLEEKVKGYIPGAVLRNLRPDSPEDEHWSNEV